MVNSIVKTVGFSFLSPEALNVIMMHQYNVVIYSGEPPNLSEQKPNVVILPNIELRSELAPLADKIHRLLLHSQGKRDPLKKLGITPLDVDSEDESFRPLGKRTPSDYIEQIESAAIDLDLVPTSKSKPKKKAKVVDSGSVDQYLQYFNDSIPSIDDFDMELEFPVAQYCAGNTSNKDLRNALKALAEKNSNEQVDKLLGTFYTWLKDDYGPRIQQALKQHLWPENGQAQSAQEAAERNNVALVDVQQITVVLNEIKGEH